MIPDNRDRAEWAQFALRAFRERVHMPDAESVDTALGDLLTNLHHLADRKQLDWDALLARAQRYYEEEVAEEREEAAYLETLSPEARRMYIEEERRERRRSSTPPSERRQDWRPGFRPRP